MSLQHIINLNNYMVFLLESKQSSWAVKNGVHAMELMDQLNEDQHLTLASQSSLSVPCKQEDAHDIDHYMHYMEHSDLYDWDEPSDDYVYERGVTLPSTVTDFKCIIAVLIFNLALSHQLSASTRHQHDDLRQKLLHKAKRLYELALREQIVDHSTAFKFAAVNNVAVIYRMMGDDETSQKYLDYLVSLRMHVVSVGDCPQLQQMNGFWRNVFGKGISIAPAA
ncbi:unnamed protein product [Cylindrotheca closterium]|uniref:Uncharacterized protein n=1 Tax=Cylindrotheca closterium TaxID=2856 RepID=A0AAD2FIS1_9STRA|nr:unnamed protein product [Cylindrotheca closterium]